MRTHPACRPVRLHCERAYKTCRAFGKSVEVPVYASLSITLPANSRHPDANVDHHIHHGTSTFPTEDSIGNRRLRRPRTYDSRSLPLCRSERSSLRHQRLTHRQLQGKGLGRLPRISGLIGLMKNTGAFYGSKGIRCNAIMAGAMDTNISDSL